MLDVEAGVQSFLDHEINPRRRHPPADVYVEKADPDDEFTVKHAMISAGRSTAIPGAPTHHPTLKTNTIQRDTVRIPTSCSEVTWICWLATSVRMHIGAVSR